MGDRSPWRWLRRIFDLEPAAEVDDKIEFHSERRWTRVFQRDPRSEVDDELQHHLEQRVRDYVARGIDPETARNAALDRFGNVDRVRSECAGLLTAERRAEERRVRLNVSWLDVKLGVRMLAKYPGLSLVAVIGLTVAIVIGAGSFGVLYSLMDPTLPLDEGDRVISIVNNRADRPGVPDRRSLHDFFTWRDELRSVEDVGAFRRLTDHVRRRADSRNLIRVGSDFMGTGYTGGLPFWVELGLSPGLIAYVAALAVLAAVIAGVLPALKATGRRVQAGLQQLSSRGSQLQLGRMWTAAVGGGDLCDDVVHGYAAAARDRHPRSARRAYARNPQRHLRARCRAARNGCDGRPDPGRGARLANGRVAHGRPVAPRPPRRRGVGHGGRAACGARPGTARAGRAANRSAAGGMMRNGSRWRRLRRVFRQDPAAEVDDELEFHLEEWVRDDITRGMSRSWRGRR